MKIDFGVIITMKGESVKEVYEELEDILKELLARNPQGWLDSRKGIYDYDFYTSINIREE